MIAQLNTRAGFDPEDAAAIERIKATADDLALQIEAGEAALLPLRAALFGWSAIAAGSGFTLSATARAALDGTGDRVAPRVRYLAINAARHLPK